MIWTSEAAWPPPMSGTPARTSTVPSIWSSTHALDQSWSQTIRPYEVSAEATPRPTRLPGPEGARRGPRASQARRAVSGSHTAVSSSCPEASRSPFRR